MWLVQTINELNSGGVPKAKLLPSQTLNGNPIDETLTVSCDNASRRDNPIGTIFEVDNLELKSTERGSLYYTVDPPGVSIRMRVHKPK